ncbi:PH domain-containing protein [Timonella senegalensis]|uniref:PH domain-containing protein n=1 Tax=Timonella senegalensis TaxID=1465825 RepID=UPI00030A7C97|nr:PH domain-containing protein [Timonella senegalensis]
MTKVQNTDPSNDQFQPEAAQAPEPVGEPQELDWFRCHGASPLLSSAWALLLVGFFGARIVMRELESDSTDFTVLWLVVAAAVGIAALTLAITTFVWRRTEFALDGTYLHCREGKVNKESRKIALASVDAVDIERATLAKLTGFASLTVRETGSKPIVMSYLRLDRANALRARLLSAPTPSTSVAEPAEPAAGTVENQAPVAPAKPQIIDDSAPLIYELPTQRLLVSLAWRWVLLVPFLLLAAAVLVVLALRGVQLIGPDDIPGFTAATILKGVIAVALAVVGVVKLVSKNYMSRVRVGDGRLAISRGLISDFSSTINLGSVHWVVIKQPMVWRWVGWWQVRLLTVTSSDGSDDDSEDEGAASQIVLPVATMAEVSALLEVLERAGVAAFEPAIGLATRATEPDVRTTRRARFVSPIAWGREGFTIADRVLFSRAGRYSTKLTVIPLAKVQQTALSRGPFDRSFGLADVDLLGAQDVGALTIRALDHEDADELFAHLLGVTATPIVHRPAHTSWVHKLAAESR